MSLHIGIGTFSGQVPQGDGRSVADAYADVLALARLADQVGFDSFWVSEHHGAADSHLPSPLVMLAAAAGVTRRLMLGTGVALGPFQHPLRFAEDCAVVDQLSRGRLIVGIGVGWRREEFEAFGIPMGERAQRTTELVQICRTAWDAERFSFRGRYFTFENACVTPKPVRRLRLLMGGSAPRAIARAALLADGFLGTGTPQIQLSGFRKQVEAFDQAAREAGRDPTRLAIGFHVNAWVSSDGQVPVAVRKAMWHKIGTSLAWHADHPRQNEQRLPALDEELIRARAFMGTPEDVVRQVRPWIEEFAGRELHVLFRIHHPGLLLADSEPAVRLFGAEVIPALRRLAGREIA